MAAQWNRKFSDRRLIALRYVMYRDYWLLDVIIVISNISKVSEKESKSVLQNRKRNYRWLSQ